MDKEKSEVAMGVESSCGEETDYAGGCWTVGAGRHATISRPTGGGAPDRGMSLVS